LHSLLAFRPDGSLWGCSTPLLGAAQAALGTDRGRNAKSIDEKRVSLAPGLASRRGGGGAHAPEPVGRVDRRKGIFTNCTMRFRSARPTCTRSFAPSTTAPWKVIRSSGPLWPPNPWERSSPWKCLAAGASARAPPRWKCAGRKSPSKPRGGVQKGVALADALSVWVCEPHPPQGLNRSSGCS